MKKTDNKALSSALRILADDIISPDNIPALCILEAADRIDELSQLSHNDQTMWIMAARYAHSRNTGASLAVVKSVQSNWDRFDKQCQDQLIREADDASCNYSDWDMLKSLTPEEK